jgi:hypothetical protein
MTPECGCSPASAGVSSPRMNAVVRAVLLLCVAALPFLATACAAPAAAGWQRVGGPLYTVSGLAFTGTGGRGDSRFLVVHDNKEPGEPHLGELTLGAGPLRYRHLRWPRGETPPVDLESVSAIPDAPGRFLALESRGRLFHLRFDGGAPDVLHVSNLPGVAPGARFEGLSVQKLGGRLIIVWAHRGDGKHPGRIFWGDYNPVEDAVTQQGEAEIVVPYPRGAGTRHVSDLRVDPAGILWVSACKGVGNEGPFHSAVYAIGTLETDADAIRFHINPMPTRLWTFGHKVEAIELVPGRRGGVFFGADDEKKGGWVYQAGGAR